MKKEVINQLIKSGNIRLRQFDGEKIKSLIESAEINAGVANDVSLNEKSATLIFREIYESVRQLGESKLWIEGFEPIGAGSHGISLDSLKELDIKEKIRFNYLDRFKKIRHDANYRGYRVLISQAQEIIDFWHKCSKEIISILKKKL